MMPEDKRLGILRTFHHKLYDKDAYPSKPRRLQACFQFYCVKNKCCGICIFVSVALVIVGVFSLVYSYMLPILYTFERDENVIEKIGDSRVEYNHYRGLFIIVGIVLISLAVLCLTFGLVCPFYMNNQQSMTETEKEECERTPIMVNYELPPYDKSYKSFYDDSSEESIHSSYETEKFKAILVQSNS